MTLLSLYWRLSSPSLICATNPRKTRRSEKEWWPKRWLWNRYTKPRPNAWLNHCREKRWIGILWSTTPGGTEWLVNSVGDAIIAILIIFGHDVLPPLRHGSWILVRGWIILHWIKLSDPEGINCQRFSQWFWPHGWASGDPEIPRIYDPSSKRVWYSNEGHL